MAQDGSLSITFANTFSASSYSNECNNFTPRLTSSFTASGQDVSNTTVPNCLSAGPHTIKSPFFRSIPAISSLEGVFFSLQANRQQNDPNKKDWRSRDDFIIRYLQEGT